jgi:hypothetical protein
LLQQPARHLACLRRLLKLALLLKSACQIPMRDQMIRLQRDRPAR